MSDQRNVSRFLFGPALLAGLVSISSGCTHPLMRNLTEYKAAKKRGDYHTAGNYLTDDARIWFNKKVGDGAPLRAKGGPYANWDRVFKSTGTKRHVRAKGQTVTYISSEINDYYRLIERVPTPARVTYFFDEHGLINGMLYAGLSPRGSRPPDRSCEFRQWTRQKYPGLIDSDEMAIPNQPERWRELLIEWRADVGLPAVALAP